ncbi:MAG: hypothetical protein Q4D79_03985 [Propionibacteriaceae bacterium]|nr:hypothetical protein [Propionibacteriaceae bacterium]
MTDLETRIRRARPHGAHRTDPLTERAQREMHELTSRAAAQDAPLRRKPVFWYRRVLVAAMASVLVTGGSLTLVLLPRPVDPAGVPEAEHRSSAEAPVTRYETIADLTAASEAVVQVTVVDSTVEQSTQHGAAIVAEVQVVANLRGAARPGDRLQVIQPGGELEGTDYDARHTVDFATIDGEGLVLFLTSGPETGVFVLTSAPQGVLAVDGNDVTSVFDDPLFAQVRTLAELRGAVGR